MELNGKRIYCLGDSITYGFGVDNPDNVYPARLAAASGATVFAYGVCGARITLHHPAALRVEETPPDISFCVRAEEMDDDADIVVVFGGTNDFGAKAKLGTPADRTPDTFYGACHTLFTYLKKKYPAATILVMTPLHRNPEEHPAPKDGTPPASVLSDFCAVLCEVAKAYSLPILDLYNKAASIDPHSEEACLAYMPDGLHPNDDGQAVVADLLLAFLKDL